MDDLDATLDAALEKRTAEPASETVDVLVGGSVWTLKFTELDSADWADARALNPMRPQSQIDRHFGHNYHGTARVAAPQSGVRLVDGEPVSLTIDQWAKLFKAISARDFQAVADTLLALHDFLPEQRLEQAKKALRPASVKKRRSPAK